MDRFVLAVGAGEGDRSALEAVFRPAGWQFFAVPDCGPALEFLSSQRVAVVICAADVRWRDMVSEGGPAVIVASRAADEQLWADVLNSGGFDVVSIPFDATEVLRSAEIACHAAH